jgi:uncharacterized protein
MAGIRARWQRAALPIAAAVGIVVMGMSLENSFLYFPTRELASTPQAHGLRAEELTLTAEDGTRLFGWRLHGDGKRAFLFFHGNAGNIGDRLDRARMLHDRFGLDVFLVDYRGYGRSAGSPSEEGLYRDARTVYAAARERGFAPERIVLFGESLGSAVAIELASALPCGAVILETPFLSVPAMARQHYPLVPPFLIRSRYDSERRIGTLTVPKLFLVAERDEIAPPAQGLRLFELAPPPKTLYVIPGAHHNDTYVVGGEPYWAALGGFLASLA